MGMCLIASALDLAQLGHWVIVILQVAFALGFVIFVHELGHFAVARMCGVKCEKFMIGFDVGGLKLSRKWGETEYGIGIVPFGGYVKMLGQDDNPANIAEQVRESQVAGNATGAKEITGPDGTKYLVDPRSYLAKSVPQRMAIISAGVVMNAIFAVIFATVAYKIGVPYNPSIASGTSPGSPAWRADIRPGDEVTQVGDIFDPSYDDLRGKVMLGDMENGVKFLIRRGQETIPKTLKPEQGENKGLARVGIMMPYSLRLAPKIPVAEGSPAATAQPELQGGDEVIAVNGQPVRDYAEFSAIVAQNLDKPLSLKVRREQPESKSKPEQEKTFTESTVDVPVRPLRTLGLVMQMGKVTAVQENSPAAEAKIKPGDYIERIAAAGDAAPADAAVRDPLLLPEDLRRMADSASEAKLVLRPGDSDAEGRQPRPEVIVPLRKANRIEEPIAPNDPVSIPALGLAYRVLSVVQRVEPGSPADKAGLKKGDTVTKAVWTPPAGSEIDMSEKERSIEFSTDEQLGQASWPTFISRLQSFPAGSTVKLTYLRGREERTTDALNLVAVDGYFAAERGLNFLLLTRTRIADTWSEAFDRGYDETTRSLGMVYRFLNKLTTGQVPVSALGGPVTIAQAAGFSAFEGLGKLLVFLTMLSANLAVINFLPIPLLDGGHMVFLLWEGIRGKPAGERFVVALHTVGFVFIITLMLFVLSLDFGLIPRNL